MESLQQSGVTAPPEMLNEKPVVLYVDDEEDNLVVFKSTFRKNYKIFTATSAAEGRRIVRENPDLHVIITDQRMPETNGVEFLRSILTENPDPIRMVLSGFSDMEAIINAINEGKIYRYIPKPWDENDIKLTIDAAIELFLLQRRNRELMGNLAEYNKRLEATVDDRTKDLQEANEKKTELLGIVAHDLKNPLMGILGTADMLRSADEYNISGDDKEMLLEQIWKAGNRMSDLIHSLLDINAIESGKIAIRLAPISLSTTAQALCYDYHPRAEAKNITIHFDTTDNEAMIVADEQLLQQVIDNLLSNAVKYSPPDKNVWVSVGVGEDATTSAKTFRVIIKDEGPGLSQEDHGQLFGRFTKLTARPTAGEDSTGLGLSIVKSMMEQMNGLVWCETELGKGATFIAEFPAFRGENG
jgi:two-component system, sensor histidine kinase and response regulator